MDCSRQNSDCVWLLDICIFKIGLKLGNIAKSIAVQNSSDCV